MAAHWDRATYEAALGPEGAPRIILVSEERGRITGFVVAHIIDSEWEIENIVVAEAAQRSGLGSQLLRSLLEVARQRKASAVFLEVRESNASARALYTKAGFLLSGRRKGYYRNRDEDAILYRLDHP
jgi:ribosomal-protein-alanine N-acetyltransferase